MNGKRIATRAVLAAVGGVATLVLAAGPAPATMVPLGSVTTNTTVTLTGGTRASLAVVAAASTSGRADVRVLGGSGSVLASGNAKVAADAQLSAAYSLKAALGTVVAVTATPRTDGCVAVSVSATGATSGTVKATVASGGVSTVVQSSVNSAGPGEVASVVVCAQVKVNASLTA